MQRRPLRLRSAIPLSDDRSIVDDIFASRGSNDCRGLDTCHGRVENFISDARIGVLDKYRRRCCALVSAGMALAIAGDTSQSSTLAADLEKRFPEDTSVRFSYLPALRAMIALNQGQPSKALELLQPAAPYELGSHRSSFSGLFGNLYPSYVRGEAYLAVHRGAEAVAEFQRIREHRGIVVIESRRPRQFFSAICRQQEAVSRAACVLVYTAYFPDYTHRQWIGLLPFRDKSDSIPGVFLTRTKPTDEENSRLGIRRDVGFSGSFVK